MDFGWSIEVEQSIQLKHACVLVYSMYFSIYLCSIYIKIDIVRDVTFYLQVSLLARMIITFAREHSNTICPIDILMVDQWFYNG